MILFEFDDYKDLKNEVPANFNLNDFKNHLTSIWKNRKAFDDYDDISTREDFLPSEKNNQAFLNFNGTKIQARNYVGFIK